MSQRDDKKRKYPKIPYLPIPPKRPISFVVVRFCDDCIHNILKSKCLKNPINELIIIDNTGNLAFENLTEAMAAGISQTRFDLIAVVHEDVLLPDHWQTRFEITLEALEMVAPNWAVLGSVGWTIDHQVMGHWSDPHKYANTFSGKAFHRVSRLDEQILVFHRARLLDLDLDLPGIHHIGRDLPLIAQERGMNAFAIDAPTIHKYADQNGKRIQNAEASPKIVERKTLRYLADRAHCNEYIKHKWPKLDIADFKPPELDFPDMEEPRCRKVDEPVILVARGGSGSRLLSILCQDAGVFLGNELNASGDTLEMVIAIYQGLIEKYRGRADWQKRRIVPRLRAAAAKMLLKSENKCERWGFKVPESILLLPELRSAFPRARFLHLVRDPLTTCLRRTHMTARLDNCIGRICLSLAYDDAGKPRAAILDDSPALHMAFTTLHQLKLARKTAAEVGIDDWKQIRFEELVEAPAKTTEEVGDWLGSKRQRSSLEHAIDPDRIKNPGVTYSPEVEEIVRAVLYSMRRDLEYVSGAHHG